MKFNYKKIAALSTSVLLTSMTLGIASAVSYPSEFSDAGNSAVVYGANAASTDQAQASNINEDLSSIMSGGAATVGDESFLISATGDDLTFKEPLSDVTESLDDGDLSNLLAEGTLEDDSIDYDEEEEVTYFQDIYLSGDSVTFEALDDDDYVVNTDLASDELPVLQIDQSTGEAYNLTVDFATEINASAYDDGESIMVFGKELSFDPEMKDGDTELVMYESTETITLGAGESLEVNGDTVEVLGANTDKDSATISINGQQHQVEKGDKEGDYYVNSIFMQTVPTETASVELFVGAKEWSIDGVDDLKDVEVDNEAVEGVEAKVVSSSKADVTDIDSITFKVTPSDMEEDEKSYLEIGEALEDPLFDISMVFESAEPELKADSKGKIELSAGNEVSLDFTSRNENEYSVSPYEINDDDDAVNAGDNWYANATYSNLQEDHIFIASEGTGKSEETLVYQVSKINDGDDTPSVEFTDLSDSSTVKVYHNNEIGNTDLYVSNITDGDESFSLEVDGDLDTADVSVKNNIVTENGMEITLKREATINVTDAVGANFTLNGVKYDDTASNLNSALNSDGYDASLDTSGTNDIITISGYQVGTLVADENATTSINSEIYLDEDADDVFTLDDEVTLSDITVDVEVDTDDEELEVRATEGSDFEAVSSSETDMEYALSELGTYYEADEDEYASIDIWTPSEGQTVYNVYVSATDTSATSEGGSQIYTSDESASYEGKNVVIVGGSCINAAAAEALGVVEGTCESDFTDATGVGEGQFLIQKVENYPEAGKTAIVVAGYSADDTRAAAETLINQDVELSTDGEVYSAATKEVVTTA